MFRMAVRAKHFALFDLREDSLETPPAANSVGDSDLLQTRIRVMEHQATRMVFATSRTSKLVLQLDEPLRELVSSR
jgi:hypothetical protein